MLRNILVVIINPKVGWQYIDDSANSTQRVLSSVFFPLLAILALACFVPMIYDSATNTLSHTLMEAIVWFSKFMLTFYLCSYLLLGFYPQFNRSQISQAKLNNYIIYNLSFLIILSILIKLLNGEFSPLYFLLLYMPYIAFRGSEYLFLEKGKKIKFVTISSIMMLAFPFIIEYILDSLIMR